MEIDEAETEAETETKTGNQTGEKFDHQPNIWGSLSLFPTLGISVESYSRCSRKLRDLQRAKRVKAADLQRPIFSQAVDCQ